MSFVILKFSSSSPSHSKEKLKTCHVLQGSPWSGLQPPLWPCHPPLSLWLMLFIHTCLLADPQTCQKKKKKLLFQGLCTCCTCYSFTLLQQSFSREPITYSFIILRSLPKYQLSPSPSPSLSLYCFIFLHKKIPPGSKYFLVYV